MPVSKPRTTTGEDIDDSFDSFVNTIELKQAPSLVTRSLPAHWTAPTALALEPVANEFVTPTGEVLTQLHSPHQYLPHVFAGGNAGPRLQRAISSTRRNVEMREIPFDGANEGRPSCLRKRVLPDSTIGWTRNCVVLDQRNLPDYLFTDLSLIDRKGWLVEDFSYEKLQNQKKDDPHDWKIVYNRGEVVDKRDYAYVKVITKNSYWAELLWTLLKGGMVFAMTEYSHFTFINTLSNDTPPLHLIGHPKIVMMVCWTVFIFLRIVAATLSAQFEWQADAESGPDVVRESTSHLSAEEEARILKQTPLTSGTEPLPKIAFTRRARRLEQWRAFLALVIFQLIGVPGILRDITVFLHPWKGLQPYAAFKADGARAYLLGFPHGSLYKIENRPRHEMRYSLTFCMTCVLTYLKVRVRYPLLRDVNDSYTSLNLIVELFPSVLTMMINSIGYLRLIRSKWRCRAWLEEQLHSTDVKQQQVAQRLLKKHYGVYFRLSSIIGTPNQQAPEMEAMKRCTDRCAELARELQLWQITDVLADELQSRGIDPQDAERFLSALRDIARPTQSLNDSFRGPNDTLPSF